MTPYLDVLKDFRSEFTVVSVLATAGMSPGLAHQASASFDDLSEEDQRAAKWAGKLDSRKTYGARAWLHKDKELKWVVTGINCPRC
jgi:hypothetical protein